MSSERQDYKLDPAGAPVAEDAEDPGFLGRWARRKRQVEQDGEGHSAEDPQALPAQAETEVSAEEVAEEKIDPRTGKPYSELTDADMPDLESLTPDSDLSVFMARNVSPALRMKALTRVFHSAKFNKVCLCAEYADDYTNFVPMGDIVPHDLKAAIVREATRLVERLKERGLEISEEDARARIAAESRGEKLPDIESLAQRTADGEIARAEDERPERLQS